MPTAKLDDVAIHYEVTGQGRPIVLTHGLAGSVATWQSTTPLFAELGYQATAVDLRGHGASEDGPPLPTIPRLVEDLRQLMDQRGIERATLAGHSVGGRAMLLFALTYPERVEKLVLYAMQGSAPRGEHRELFQMFAELAERDGMDAVWANEKYQATAALRGLKKDAALLEAYRASFVQNRPSGYAAMIRAILEMPDLVPRLGEVRCPTLLLVGSEDGSAAFADVAARAIPSAKLAVIPGAGHFLHVETPSAFVAELRAFLVS